ncbi:MAG: UDP-N-acetylglucosamine 2-epimerase, partial [Candidatus Micrarchaeia archaeon]
HPRTNKMLQQFGLESALKHLNIKLVEPVGYVDMLWLEKNAFKILTDSGGVQREAVWLDVPCLVLREETEWSELVEQGKIVVVGVKKKSIVSSV